MKSFCWFYPVRGQELDLAKPLKASEMFWNHSEPRGGHFKSQTSEIRPCTKNVNILSGTPKAILY